MMNDRSKRTVRERRSEATRLERMAKKVDVDVDVAERQLIWGMAVTLSHLIGFGICFLGAFAITAAFIINVAEIGFMWSAFSGVMVGTLWIIANYFILARRSATPIYRLLCRRKGLQP